MFIELQKNRIYKCMPRGWYGLMMKGTIIISIALLKFDRKKNYFIIPTEVLPCARHYCVCMYVCVRVHASGALCLLRTYNVMCVQQKLMLFTQKHFIKASVVFRTAVVNLLCNQCNNVCRYVIYTHATYSLTLW